MSAPLPNLPLPAHTDRNSLRPVLDRIAGTTVMYLQQGDYLSEGEATPLLAAYGEKLGAATGVMPDFLNFTAETQAQKHSLTVEGELVRMQKVLRNSLNDRVHYWSFGPLSGRASALYDHCPGLRPVCMALGCPATLAGETSIVHVASLNPVSALVASFWISQELNRTSEGDAPFVFTFFTDLPAWQVLMQRHFAS
jgi:hypothetical protein